MALINVRFIENDHYTNRALYVLCTYNINNMTPVSSVVTLANVSSSARIQSRHFVSENTIQELYSFDLDPRRS